MSTKWKLSVQSYHETTDGGVLRFFSVVRAAAAEPRHGGAALVARHRPGVLHPQPLGVPPALPAPAGLRPRTLTPGR